ncbi:MAG TPA: phosphoribosylformylglycinamidine cyclo-ligase [Actinomycetes bacterium]|nr:phosphoribosylformylglycinamidine cyclo-ligase [Actinomycetes bacterium]
MTIEMQGDPLSYAEAGVDVEAGEQAVALMRAAVEATHGPKVLGGIGGFAGLWRLAGDRGPAGILADPVLAAASDGVGTKLLVAQALDRHDTVGIDLVAMVVDDVVVTGAEPLFVLDYLAVGRVDPERVAAIVAGVAEGCRLARCALLGGETAEHPDAMEPDAYDLAGFAIGMVERERLLGPERVAAGDVLLGLASSGLHANGFSLARRVLARAGIGYERDLPELGPVGEALLTPTRIYAPHLCDLLAAGVEVHALCHVTGGGLPGNLPRCLPPGLTARVDRASWDPPPVFRLLAELGPVEDDELARATNLGVGMVAVLPAAEADRAAAFLADREVPSWVIGDVAPSS